MVATASETEVRRRLVRFVLATLAIAAVGTAGYMVIEGWTLIDAVYMVVITLSTVGFGEIRPLSEVGRVFTIGLILAGVTNAAYLVSVMGEYVVSGAFQGSLRRKRMEKAIDRLRGHYIVCGYGRVGRQVVEDLERRHKQCVVVESNAGALDGGLASPQVQGDASDNGVLQQAGIERARGLVATTGDDAVNVFITLTARALNPGLTIVARSNAPATDRKLVDAGASHVISPFTIAGRRISAQLLFPSITDFLDVIVQAGGMEMVLEEIHVTEGSALVGDTLTDAQVRSRTGANILAVRSREKGQFITNPDAEFRFSPGDVLVVLGTAEALGRLGDLAGQQPGIIES